MWADRLWSLKLRHSPCPRADWLHWNHSCQSWLLSYGQEMLFFGWPNCIFTGCMCFQGHTGIALFLTFEIYCSPFDVWKTCLAVIFLRQVRSLMISDKVSSQADLGCRRQENESESFQIPLWHQPRVEWMLPAGAGDALCRENSTMISVVPHAQPVSSLPQGVGLYMHLVWRSSDWERISMDISLYWSVLMFTRAGKFFLCKQAELIEPAEWAALNSFLLSSVSSSMHSGVPHI